MLPPNIANAVSYLGVSCLHLLFMTNCSCSNIWILFHMDRPGVSSPWSVPWSTQCTPSGLVTDLKMEVNPPVVCVYKAVWASILNFISVPRLDHHIVIQLVMISTKATCSGLCECMHMHAHIRENASDFLLSASSSCMKCWALVTAERLFTVAWPQRGRCTLVCLCMCECAHLIFVSRVACM